MWQCPQCGEMLEANFGACWKCGTDPQGAPPPDPDAYMTNPEPKGLAFETACPVCGQTAYSWGSAQGQYPLTFQGPDASLLGRLLMGSGHSVSARLCQNCGNLQLFVQDYLEQPPQV